MDGTSFKTPTQNKEMCLHFFQLLTGEKNPSVRIKTFPDHGNATGHSMEFEGPVDFWWEGAVERQRMGHGIFYFVNIVKHGKGSSPRGYTCGADVIGVREIVTDHDTGLPAHWHVTPALVVATSTLVQDGKTVRKGHAHWILNKEPRVILADWSVAQKRVARHYGADETVSDFTRVLRVPGFLHLKDPTNPQLITFTADTDGLPLEGYSVSLTDVLAGMPTIDAKAQTSANTGPTPEGVEWDMPDNIAVARDYLRREVAAGRVAIEDDQILNGNSRLFKVGCMLWDMMITEETARTLVWEDFNPHCRPPWVKPDDPNFTEPLGRAYHGGAGNKNPGTKGHADPSITFRDVHSDGAGPFADSDGDDNRFMPFVSLFDDDKTPVLPLASFPKPIQDWFHNEAARKGVKPEVFAVPALVGVAAALHTSFQIQHTADPTWLERPILWGMTIGDASTVKSPTQQPVLSALAKIDERHRLNFSANLRSFELHNAEWLKERDKWMAKNPDRDPEDFAGAAPSVPEPCRDVITMRAGTTEGYREVLLRNRQRGPLIHSDELGEILCGMDAYRGSENKGIDRGLYNTAWSAAGSGTSLVPRAGKSLYLRHWWFSILGTMQYERFAELAKSNFNFSSDGLLARFIFCGSTPAGKADHGLKPNFALQDALNRIEGWRPRTPVGGDAQIKMTPWGWAAADE